MGVLQKLVGWGANTLTDPDLGMDFNDIVMDSTDVSYEEGAEEEAPCEGNRAEARKKDPDTYVMKARRRIDDETEVEGIIGYKETVSYVKCVPDNGGLGIKLLNVSRHIGVRQNTKDGLVAEYTYKTKRQTDDDGNLTDVKFCRNDRNVTYTAVDSTAEGYSNKNPKNEGWYIKNGADYIRSWDAAPQNGMTYYVRAVTVV